MIDLRAAVVGQLARDLVLLIDRVPGAGSAMNVRLRREMLGGKGANQAVALAQLGIPVALVAVAGTDDVGRKLLRRAAHLQHHGGPRRVPGLGARPYPDRWH